MRVTCNSGVLPIASSTLRWTTMAFLPTPGAALSASPQGCIGEVATLCCPLEMGRNSHGRLCHRRSRCQGCGTLQILRGAVAALEGERPKRIVVLEFASRNAAQRWYDSEDYREARAIREKAAISRLF